MKLQFLGRFSETRWQKELMYPSTYFCNTECSKIIYGFGINTEAVGSISLCLCLWVSLSLSPSPQPQTLAPARWRRKQPYYKWSAVPPSNSFRTQEGCRIARQLQSPPGLLLSLLWIGKTWAQLERVGRDGGQQALNDRTAGAMFV